MGSKERRAKEKSERKEFILSSAMNVIRSCGVEALTMRKLADVIEYSPCVVYELFSNKDALMIDLFSKVCVELLHVMRAVPSSPTPEEYFRQLIWRDVEFMMQESHRVELFMMVSMESSPKKFPPEMQEVIQLIENSLKNLGYPKLATHRDIEDAQDVLRTFLAGLLKLLMTQKSASGLARCKRILENGLTVLLNGWKS